VDATTRQISEFAANLTYEDIPEDVRQIAIQHIVDSLACGYGARDCDAAAIARTLAHEVSGEFTGRMIGSTATVAADIAGFVNAAAIRYFDYSDTMVPGGHPSDCLGGLLAVAAGRGTTGKQLITAFVSAYEVFARFGESAYVRKKGYDQGVTVGIALAAGLGTMLGMDAERIGHAVSLATVTCISLRATRAGTISAWKGAATAEAVRETVFLTALAEKGLTGPPQPFEGRHGIWEIITGPFTFRPFPSEGGDYLFLTNAHLKYWPVEFNTQVAVWGARELREKVDIADLESVHLMTYWSAWHETASEKDKWDPTTRETADHSLPYIFSRALVDGEITIGSFDEDKYLAADIRPVMNLVTAGEDDELNELFPRVIAMKIQAKTKSGETIDIYTDKARGHALNRMSPEETSDKYRKLVTLDDRKVDAGLAFWWSLAEQPSIIEGLDLLS
jgi:2-methylcitrate dehydratase